MSWYKSQQSSLTECADLSNLNRAKSTEPSTDAGFSVNGRLESRMRDSACMGAKSNRIPES